MVSDHELLKLLLPEFLVAHFDITQTTQYNNGELHIYFEESSSISDQFKERQLESKGFLPEIIVYDYLKW